ncbi:MAG TPA: hypothetical protein VG297_23000 [Bryobacteraceae bacterium]|nr:hypothetical protein [Bryobacteraceae bacterium]
MPVQSQAEVCATIVPDPARRSSEAGFALLMIYAMAAIVAITLYMELPRVAFEAQRDKEQLLIDRGEQYSRAVMLYVRKFNRYPADFDALQNTQNLRFLRHKYVDPMTGKDDWRLIHVGPGGVFTDSLLYTKKKDPNKPDVDPNTTVTLLGPMAGNSGGQGGANLATRQRPSDQPGAPGDPNNPQPLNNPQQPPNNQPFPNNPAGVNGPVQVLPDGRIVPAFQGQLNQVGGTLEMGQTVSNPAAPNQGLPNQAQPGFPNPGFPNPGFPNQGAPNPAFPNQPANQPFPNQPLPGQMPAGSPFPNNNTQLPNNNTQQGAISNGPPANAANLINQILTTPRPGGLNGLGMPQGQQPQAAPVDAFGNPQPINSTGGLGATPTAQAGLGNNTNNTGTPLPQQPAGQTIGGGIAGVASKLEQEGVKVYRDRTSYNEWEFVYDITKDTSRGGAGAQATPNPAANPASNSNNSPFSNTSPFSSGTQPGTGTPPANPGTGTPPQ